MDNCLKLPSTTAAGKASDRRAFAIPPIPKHLLLAYLQNQDGPSIAARLRFPLRFASGGNESPIRILTRPKRYLRIAEVRSITGLATSTLYRLIKHAQFPRPMQLGPNCVGWSEEEVATWCSTRKPRNRITRS
jgi:prophage regulatory protein